MLGQVNPKMDNTKFGKHGFSRTKISFNQGVGALMKLPCFTILFLERLTKCWTNWAFQQVDVKLCVSCRLNFISLVARHFIPKIFNRKLFEHRLFRQSVFKNNPCSHRYIFRFWLVKVVSVVPRAYLPMYIMVVEDNCLRFADGKQSHRESGGPGAWWPGGQGACKGPQIFQCQTFQAKASTPDYSTINSLTLDSSQPKHF